VNGKTVVAVSVANQVFAFDIQGRLLWKTTNNGGFCVHLTATSVRGTPAYFCASHKFSALDADSGDVLWEISPPISDYGRWNLGKVFSVDGRLVALYDNQAFLPVVYMYAFNSSTGALQWQFQIGGGFSKLQPFNMDNLAFYNGEAFVSLGDKVSHASGTSYIAAVALATGQQSWKVELPEPSGKYSYFRSLSVNSATGLIATHSNNKVYAVSALSRQIEWDYPISYCQHDPGQCWSSCPVSTDDGVVMLTAGGLTGKALFMALTDK
jgi:outer membrane protein assembly factor BamB